MGGTRATEDGQPHAIVHRVLNNNVVIRIDARGDEQVLMGKGIGFQRKPDDPIDLERVEKTFVLARDVDAQHAHSLLADVPYEVVAAVTAAVEDAERSMGRSLGSHMLVAVIDHVQFVLQRLREGIRIPSAAMPELAVLYPDELRAAERMVETLGSRLAQPLPPEEAVFLSMHVLNATRDEPDGAAVLLLRRVQHVVHTVERELGIALDAGSADFARFVLHVRFLLQRVVTDSMLTSRGETMYGAARSAYPRAHAVAEQVRAYLDATAGCRLTDEEMLYLTIHVERLAARTDRHGTD